MRKILQYFSLKKKASFILLNLDRTSPINNITFLQSNLKLTPLLISNKLSNSSFSPQTTSHIKSYLTLLQKNCTHLTQIQNSKISVELLEEPILKSLSNAFALLKSSLQQQLHAYSTAPSRNIQPIINIASTLNITDFHFWNKLIMLGSQQYQHMNREQKCSFLTSLNHYVYKFSITKNQNFGIFTFAFSQKHLQDLADFSFVIKLMQQSSLLLSKQNTPQYTKELHTLINKIQIIQKIGVSGIINKFTFQNQFIKFIPQITSHMHSFDFQLVLDFYLFYAKRWDNLPQFFYKFQLRICEELNTPGFWLSSPQETIKIITKILNIWEFHNGKNETNITKIIEPIIIKLMPSLQETPIRLSAVLLWVNVCFRLINCQFNNLSLVQQIITKISPYFINAKHSYLYKFKIINQYLRIKKLKTKLNFSQYYQTLKISTQNPQISFQFNPGERFWETVAKMFIPPQNVIRSKVIFVYQVDIFVLYKGTYFAIEIQGNTYNTKHLFNGRKSVRQQILQSYGLTTIFIKCNDPKVQTMMRLTKTKDASMYLKSKLDEQLKSRKNE